MISTTMVVGGIRRASDRSKRVTTDSGYALTKAVEGLRPVFFGPRTPWRTWGTRPVSYGLVLGREFGVECCGIPYLAKNERDTRISCPRLQTTATCAAFIEESRMEFANAIKLDRKSGGMGHPGLVAEEGLQAWTSGAGEPSSFRGYPTLLVGEGSYRQQDQGGHGQVIEQHSLCQRNGGQQDGRNRLPCPASQCSAGHLFSLPWCLMTETERFGESRPSLF
jgi:hypothetical protein